MTENAGPLENVGRSQQSVHENTRLQLMKAQIWDDRDKDWQLLTSERGQYLKEPLCDKRIMRSSAEGMPGDGGAEHGPGDGGRAELLAAGGGARGSGQGRRGGIRLRDDERRTACPVQLRAADARAVREGGDDVPILRKGGAGHLALPLRVPARHRHVGRGRGDRVPDQIPE